MQVEIWSDIACPWCYIGKRRFEQALESFEHGDEVRVVWRSFELDPHAPKRQTASQLDLLALKYRMTREQVEAMNARMSAEAAKEGLTFDLVRVQVGNTFDAHRLLHFAATKGLRDALVERLFAGYLGEGVALGEHENLIALATDVGFEADEVRVTLASDAFADAVRLDEARAQEIGVSGVPFFVIDSRYGVSGAQSPEVLVGAIRQAWNERSRGVQMVGVGSTPTGEVAGCEDGQCEVPD